MAPLKTYLLCCGPEPHPHKGAPGGPLSRLIGCIEPVQGHDSIVARLLVVLWSLPWICLPNGCVCHKKAATAIRLPWLALVESEWRLLSCSTALCKKDYPAPEVWLPMFQQVYLVFPLVLPTLEGNTRHRQKPEKDARKVLLVRSEFSCLLVRNSVQKNSQGKHAWFFLREPFSVTVINLSVFLNHLAQKITGQRVLFFHFWGVLQ